jgi:AcrR family transcriptional regulator
LADPKEASLPRPLRRDAERNRQLILRAAAEVFTTRGLQASLDDVAHHAGVGVGTVYRRFPDKESLAEALFEERIEAMIALADKSLADPDSWAGLVSFLEGVCAQLAADRGLHQILMYAAYGRDRIARGRDRMKPLVTALVRRAQEDGKLRSDLQPTDILFIEFMISAAARYAEPVKPEIWRRYLALITDALRPERQDATALPETALDPQQMFAVMRSIPQRPDPTGRP